MPSTSRSWWRVTPPDSLKVAMARRSWSASSGVKPAATIASRIACSWNSGTPRVLPSTRSSSSGRAMLGRGGGVGDRLLAPFAPEVGMDHVALDRPGPDDRHLDDQVVEALGAEPGQHVHLRPALDLEDAEAVGPAQHGIGGRAVARQAGQVVLEPVVPAQQVEGSGAGRTACRGPARRP